MPGSAVGRDADEPGNCISVPFVALCLKSLAPLGSAFPQDDVPADTTEYRTLDLLAVNPISTVLRPCTDASPAVEGMLQMAEIGQHHYFEFCVRCALGT